MTWKTQGKLHKMKTFLLDETNNYSADVSDIAMTKEDTMALVNINTIMKDENPIHTIDYDYDITDGILQMKGTVVAHNANDYDDSVWFYTMSALNPSGTDIIYDGYRDGTNRLVLNVSVGKIYQDTANTVPIDTFDEGIQRISLMFYDGKGLEWFNWDLIPHKYIIIVRHLGKEIYRYTSFEKDGQVLFTFIHEFVGSVADRVARLEMDVVSLDTPIIMDYIIPMVLMLNYIGDSAHLIKTTRHMRDYKLGLNIMLINSTSKNNVIDYNDEEKDPMSINWKKSYSFIKDVVSKNITGRGEINTSMLTPLTFRNSNGYITTIFEGRKVGDYITKIQKISEERYLVDSITTTFEQASRLDVLKSYQHPMVGDKCTISLYNTSGVEIGLRLEGYMPQGAWVYYDIYVNGELLRHMSDYEDEYDGGDTRDSVFLSLKFKTFGQQTIELRNIRWTAGTNTHAVAMIYTNYRETAPTPANSIIQVVEVD